MMWRSRFLSLTLLAACAGTKDTGGDTAPGVTGAPFADVQAMFDRNCVSCHVTGGSMEQLLLTSGDSYDAIVGVDSIAVPGVKRVEPGDHTASYIYLKISGTHADVGGTGDPMPPPYGLAGTDLDTMSSWIDAGALAD